MPHAMTQTGRGAARDASVLRSAPAVRAQPSRRPRACARTHPRTRTRTHLPGSVTSRRDGDPGGCFCLGQEGEAGTGRLKVPQVALLLRGAWSSASRPCTQRHIHTPQPPHVLALQQHLPGLGPFGKSEPAPPGPSSSWLAVGAGGQ